MRYEKGLRSFVGDFIFAASAVLGYSILGAMGVYEGRGAEIIDCPANYKPIVEVNDANALTQLTDLAIRHNVYDSYAHGSERADKANLIGEVACRLTDKQLVSHTVLLPAGETALKFADDFDPMTGQLPNGLAWVSAPGK